MDMCNLRWREGVNFLTAFIQAAWIYRNPKEKHPLAPTNHPGQFNKMEGVRPNF
jgi:hypothetical protein